MPQYLWIGCWESEEEFKIKASKGYNLASAQVSQNNIINGLEKAGNIVFDSINGSVLPYYPIYKDRIITPTKWSHKYEAVDLSVGYKNIKYINRLNCKNSMISAAKEWIRERYEGGDLIIIAYSMRSASMATAYYLKSKIPRAKIYLIITDLPKFMDLSENFAKKFLKKLDWIYIKKLQNKFDGYILYSETMAQALKITNKKWIVMEGMYNENESICIQACQKKKAIMYSGKLEIKYGIKLLIETFFTIDDVNLELWITGGGEAVDYIKSCSKKDSRIKYFGFLSNRTEVLKYQAQASLLINMRLPSEEASSYCFPSKLLEYMASGVPVLSFKLKGIPKEYFNYLILIKDENISSMREAILKGLAVDDDFGKRASKFILDNKNIATQAQRILKFVNNL